MASDSSSTTERGGLTLILPSRNEAASLDRVIRAWWAQRPEGFDFQILIVDDASDDATPEVIRKLEAEFPVRSVRNPRRFGYGGSLRVGIFHTTTPWVAFTDADGQYDPADLPKILAATAAGSDFVSGWRPDRADPFIRIVISLTFRSLLGLFLGLRSRDPSSALKAGRTEPVREIAGRTRYMNGAFWQEFMTRWVRAGYSFVELPVRHLPRVSGQSKIVSKDLLTRVAVLQFIALLRLWREFHRLGPIATSASLVSDFDKW